MTRRLVLLPLAIFLLSSRPYAATPIHYHFTFPQPEHHWMQVEATFPELTAGTLELRMSRASPGRYSLHDFAKNVYDLQALDTAGRELKVTRPDPYGWTVHDHGDMVTVLTVKDTMCKWPIGDPADTTFGFCGHASDNGSPYCAEHARVAFQPAKKRERRAREFDYIQRLAG